MSSIAITMLILSCTLLWGGLVVSIIVMNKLKAPWQREENFEKKLIDTKSGIKARLIFLENFDNKVENNNEKIYE